MATKSQPGDPRSAAVTALLQSAEFLRMRAMVSDMLEHSFDSEQRWKESVLDSLKSQDRDSASLFSILRDCYRAAQLLQDRGGSEFGPTRIICATSVLCALLTSAIAELGSAGRQRRQSLSDQQRAAAGRMIRTLGGAPKTHLSPEERCYNDEDLGALYHPFRDLLRLWHSLANDEQGALTDCVPAPTKL